MQIVPVILAAGYGTRMKSDLPKVMHPLVGRPMIEWAVGAVETITVEKPIVVVGHGQEHIRALLGDRVEFVVQQDLLGTGHAVQQVAPLLRGRADAVLVTYGDMPLLRRETLQALLDCYQERRARDRLALAMLTVERQDPQGFGRIVRNDRGWIQAIVEEADCTPEQQRIRELNPGIYCFDAGWLWETLPQIPLSAKGEYYLTDTVAAAVHQGRGVASMLAPVEEVDGVNTRVHLAHAARVLQERILDRHMLAGVTVLDPRSTLIEDTVVIGADTTVWPGTILQGATTIGSRCQIGPHSQIVDSTIGDECRVVFSVIERALMERRCEIGPFGHLRKGAHLAEGVHLGNFGEVKNSYLGPGVKMGHFSYLGDAQVGPHVNIGAGTITCNYDGKNKYKTTIGADAFIGSDTMLVAPVAIGAGARTGAGSVVTHDVPDDGFVYGVPARERTRTPTDSAP